MSIINQRRQGAIFHVNFVAGSTKRISVTLDPAEGNPPVDFTAATIRCMARQRHRDPNPAIDFSASCEVRPGEENTIYLDFPEQATVAFARDGLSGFWDMLAELPNGDVKVLVSPDSRITIRPRSSDE